MKRQVGVPGNVAGSQSLDDVVDGRGEVLGAHLQVRCLICDTPARVIAENAEDARQMMREAGFEQNELGMWLCERHGSNPHGIRMY